MAELFRIKGGIIGKNGLLSLMCGLLNAMNGVSPFYPVSRKRWALWNRSGKGVRREGECLCFWQVSSSENIRLMSHCGMSFQTKLLVLLWTLMSRAAEKLHCVLLGPVEGPGAMVAARKVFITFNSIWYTFCEWTYLIQLLQTVRALWAWCHVMRVTSFPTDLPSTSVVLTSVLFCITSLVFSVPASVAEKTSIYSCIQF